MARNILIYGSRDLGLIAREIIEKSNDLAFMGFIDDMNTGQDILGSLEEVHKKVNLAQVELAFAIGYKNLHTRTKVFARARNFGFKIINLVSPYAYVGKGVQMGTGCLIMPGAHVDQYVKLGDGVVMWPRATASHFCSVGSHSFLSPGSTLGGHVTLGECCFVGLGAVVSSGFTVGKNCFVGANVCVYESISDGKRVVSRPNYKIKENILS